MAGKYGPADVTVTLENAPGGTAKPIHNFILNGMNAKTVARLMQLDKLGGVVTPIVSSSIANPSVITTTVAHKLVSGQLVRIQGHISVDPDINTVHVATVTGATTFTIPIDVTDDGTGGTVTQLENAFEEHVPTGKKAAESISLEGAWDTTATEGSHAILQAIDDGPQDDGRELVVIMGDSKTWTVDCRLTEYEVLAVNDAIQKFTATLQPTGSALWT